MLIQVVKPTTRVDVALVDAQRVVKKKTGAAESSRAIEMEAAPKPVVVAAAVKRQKRDNHGATSITNARLHATRSLGRSRSSKKDSALPVTLGDAASSGSFNQLSSPRTEEPVFGKGNLVSIKEHAWPGVNNPAGIAMVLKAYLDEDGDQLYDIKYIVGGRRKGVFAKFVRPHDFDY